LGIRLDFGLGGPRINAFRNRPAYVSKLIELIDANSNETTTFFKKWTFVGKV